MTNPNPVQSESDQTKKQTPDADLVRRVAQRVWELWQRELRHDRERRVRGG